MDGTPTTHGLSNAARRAIDAVAARAVGPALDPAHRVNLHFHPDREFRGEPILAAMARCGVYRSQFETGTSNGGLTAFRGGDRWRWESRIFDGAYDDAPAAERPRYGALNFRGRTTGASPRFGSAYLRLSAATLERTTFCYPDSVYEPRDFGVASRMGLIPLAERAVGDPLDGYVEAQVHGAVELARDVEALVLDPCYRGTEVERLARALAVPLEWHAGFRCRAEILVANADYRGSEYAELGRLLARDGWLTPDLIGAASRAGGHEPQTLKKVWHCLARFGDGEG